MSTENPLVPLVREALSHVDDPEIRRPITDLGMVDEIDVDDSNRVSVKVLLTVAGCPLKTTLRQNVTDAIQAIDGVSGVHVELGVMSDEQRDAVKTQLRGGVPERVIPFAQPGSTTKVIAVASGKGGVGKSSVTVNLALALAARGRNVGLLDADIYGHSVPDMLGVGDARPTPLDDLLLPVPVLDIKTISVGMLKPNRSDVIAWRGPILDRALTQLLADVHWGDLDYLLIDLPPGTGDIAMSLGQKIPNSEVLVVTTPQQAASEVAVRAGTMAGIMQQQVIGVIENMSWLETPCPHCGKTHRVELYGSGGGEAAAEALTKQLGTEVPLLGQIPIDIDLRSGGDEGDPIVVAHPESAAAQALTGLAETLDSRPRGLVGMNLGLSVAQ
ncbi:iron-sulfur cluster carrier protein ApbC [Acidipropionibacterium acidipropionici]|jgi:ATP-binding protein involved in chromosome partitioning|uniref:Iron-sulfur cluster carrier protein n=2 Tax=Acidipropionibacterium acidipropionici TaxID=1748 RepID=A0AAC9AP89_9ACTN|nr:Mrp/NBP35 family ATP-binding protein [Acidipropionibacterium acidipropionici]AFV89000.1 ParA/MinD ATPase-like protein [Acidipropionibacterium acidipropionici ATCC 4875]AMS06699.1 sodium:proton antiporter [Acidipropionibacterium acidipropionici]AOZ45487.1 sodium:proton antiporter [Acidipropionibacterium acidipropionici]AZP38509.1 iron-sulfur cluster carrier protein ApbC [Acidipropionibacterium acidipropionici]